MLCPFCILTEKFKDYFSFPLLASISLILFSCFPFFATSNKTLCSFPRLIIPFWLSVPFLISCKDFDSYLCSIREDLIAHYFLQTSFLMSSSILCLVMWIFNEKQFVPHCLLSITLQKYDDSNYLWLGYLYILILMPVTQNYHCLIYVVLLHPPFSVSTYCLLFCIEIIRPLGHETLFTCGVPHTVQVWSKALH